MFEHAFVQASSTTCPTRHAGKNRASQPCCVRRRPDALKRAIRNLLDDAVKYGEAASVTFQATPTAIKIVIDDEGPGIPERELSRVFDPFFRLEELRSRDPRSPSRSCGPTAATSSSATGQAPVFAAELRCRAEGLIARDPMISRLRLSVQSANVCFGWQAQSADATHKR